MKRKVCIVVTARASYARVKSVLTAINRQEQLQLMLVLSASAVRAEYGDLEQLIEGDGFYIAGKIDCLTCPEDPKYPPVTTAKAILGVARLFEILKPGIVVTIADRFETMAAALTAAYMNIPLAHIQGGEVTGNIDEKVRHAITKVADIHFVATESAKERVIKLGENPDHVFLTGCPAIDLALSTPKCMKDPPFADLLPMQYAMVLQHPVTTQAMHSAEQIQITKSALCSLNLPVLWFLPNADQGRTNAAYHIESLSKNCIRLNIRIINNLPPEQFLHLLHHTACLIGNSSTGIREASALGIPAVNIGARQAGRERGRNVIDVPHNVQQIQNAIQYQLGCKRYPPDPIYGTGHAGEMIASLLATLPLTTEKKITY